MVVLFFFHVAQNYPQIEEFFISDVNPNLILVYKTIQRDVESLISELETLEVSYHMLSALKIKNSFTNKENTLMKTFLQLI